MRKHEEFDLLYYEMGEFAVAARPDLPGEYSHELLMYLNKAAEPADPQNYKIQLRDNLFIINHLQSIGLTTSALYSTSNHIHILSEKCRKKIYHQAFVKWIKRKLAQGYYNGYI